VDICEQGNEHLDSVNSRKFLDPMSNSKVFKKEFTSLGSVFQLVRYELFFF
jgi:hypothetical protein